MHTEIQCLNPLPSLRNPNGDVLVLHIINFSSHFFIDQYNNSAGRFFALSVFNSNEPRLPLANWTKLIKQKSPNPQLLRNLLARQVLFVNVLVVGVIIAYYSRC